MIHKSFELIHILYSLRRDVLFHAFPKQFEIVLHSLQILGTVIIIIMKVTSLNLRPKKNKSIEPEIRQPVNIRDSCQTKIQRVENCFIMKSHMVIDRKKPSMNKTHAKINSRPRRFLTSYDKSDPVLQKQLEKSLPLAKPKQSLHQPIFDQQDAHCFSRRVSFCLKFKNEQQKKNNSNSKRVDSSWSQNRNIVNSYLINDQLATDILKLKKKRRLKHERNQSQAMFLSEFKNHSVFSQNSQNQVFSYFERAPIVSYKHSLNSPCLQHQAGSFYQEKIQKEVLESQRSVLLNSIKGQVNRTSKRMSHSKLDELLMAAKQKQLEKMINERKTHLKTSLIERKYNPYYCYLTMTKQQKAYFKKHHEMYIKTLKDNPQLENVEVCLK